MKSFRNLILALLLSFSSLAFAGEVNINTADAATIAQELDGIGEARAKAIVEYRETHGRFNALDDLLKVKGVGKAILEKNAANIKFD